MKMTLSCQYSYIDKTNGQRTYCQHIKNTGKSLCLFHLPIGEKTQADFAKAFQEKLLSASDQKLSDVFDCKGFIFPKINLAKAKFCSIADFRDARFTSDADFRGATFHGQADFHTTEFERAATFFGVYFESSTRFLGTRFHGRTVFNGSKFLAAITFHGCKFFNFAAFQATKFNTNLTFQSNEFTADADFRSAIFYEGVDFSDTIFGGRVDFEGARFHGELCLSNAHIKFLKKLECYRADLRGAVLHTTQIWENDTLTNYDFSGAFLLSVNLSGKRILDSDFTGAVFKSVLTVGWRPDRKTLANTKYIFTDYSVFERIDSWGKKLRIYSAIPSSRVPAQGEFGVGEHSNFTLYNHLHEPARLNVSLNVPAILRTAVTNYLQLFGDFVKVTEGIPVELRTRLEGSMLRVEFLAQTEDDLEIVKASFQEFQANANLNFNDLRLKIKFAINTPQLDRDLFLMKMEGQINLLRAELTYTQALLSKSEEHQAILQRIAEATRSPNSLLAPIGFRQAPEIKMDVDVASPTLSLVYSYSHKDSKLRDELDSHLSPLRSAGLIEHWHDGKIVPGQEWNSEITTRFRSADILLLLVSSDYLDSQYCIDHEFKIAIERHSRQEAVIIPIVVRPCLWSQTELKKITGLPKDMRAISNWENRDEAWNNVAEGILEVANTLYKRKTGA